MAPTRAVAPAPGENGGVKWIQYCTDSQELARFYRAADLFVHPGIQETFGLVALESQACGTPVVGIRGSLHGSDHFSRAGIVGRGKHARALADAIEAFCGKDLKSLGATAAKAAAEGYSWPRVFERLFCIYREVCANYRQP